jgi:hypothetical protein
MKTARRIYGTGEMRNILRQTGEVWRLTASCVTMFQAVLKHSSLETNFQIKRADSTDLTGIVKYSYF